MAEEKKNMQMRIGVIAAIVAILTLVAICGTFAKYVTEGSYSDSARVAKWGVTIDGDASWFSPTYYNKDSSMIVNSDTKEEGKQTYQKLVYPGYDSSSSKAIVIKGQPEVACRIDVTGTFWLDASAWTITPKGGEERFYCPLIFEFDGQPEKIDGADYDDCNQLIKDVNDAMGKGWSIPWIEPNQKLDEIFPAKNIHVYWPYERTGETDIYDPNDTALGDWAAKHPGAYPTIKLGWNVAVTQID